MSNESEVKINDVAQILQEELQNNAQVRAIIEKLRNKVKKENEGKDEEKEPRVKKKLIVGVNPATEEVAYIFEIPENESSERIVGDLNRAAILYNETRKGRMNPIKTLGETCESATGKKYLGEILKIKTKTPVQIIKLDPWTLDPKNHRSD